MLREVFMALDRRLFIQAGIGAAAFVAERHRAYGLYQTAAATPLWGTAFRGVGPGAIPVAAPDPFVASVTGVMHYTIHIAQFQDQVHPTLGPTTFWGYHPAV